MSAYIRSNEHRSSRADGRQAIKGKIFHFKFNLLQNGSPCHLINYSMDYCKLKVQVKNTWQVSAYCLNMKGKLLTDIPIRAAVHWLGD